MSKSKRPRLLPSVSEPSVSPDPSIPYLAAYRLVEGGFGTWCWGDMCSFRTCIRHQEPAWAEAQFRSFIDIFWQESERRRAQRDAMAVAIAEGTVYAVVVRELRVLADCRIDLESFLRFLEAQRVPLFSVIDHVNTRTQNVEAVLAAFDKQRERLTSGPLKSAIDRVGGR